MCVKGWKKDKILHFKYFTANCLKKCGSLFDWFLKNVRIFQVVPQAISDVASVKALEQVMRASGERSTILQSLSLLCSHSNQVWKLGSRGGILSGDCLHFTHCFCVTKKPKLFITALATAAVLPADSEGWSSTKEEVFIKDMATRTIRGCRPHPGIPVQENDLLDFCVVYSANTDLRSLLHEPSALRGRQQTCFGRSCCRRRSPFPWTTA